MLIEQIKTRLYIRSGGILTARDLCTMVILVLSNQRRSERVPIFQAQHYLADELRVVVTMIDDTNPDVAKYVAVDTKLFLRSKLRYDGCRGWKIAIDSGKAGTASCGCCGADRSKSSSENSSKY